MMIAADELIREHYYRRGAAWLSDQLGISVDAVRSRARRLGVRRSRMPGGAELQHRLAVARRVKQELETIYGDEYGKDDFANAFDIAIVD